MTTETQLSIVIPVYGSESCIRALYDAIENSLAWSNQNYEVIFVNDFSPDNSWQIIESICATDENVVGIDLRRNFGQDNAILTGIRAAKGKYVAVMDDDLQHHPKYLPAMLREIEKGFDVVYADFSRKNQLWWKNVGSWFNGKIAEWVIGKPKEVYLSPFKVIRSEVAKLISDYSGYAPYVDGLIFQTTSRVSSIEVAHQPRFSGQSNYTLSRSIGVSARLAFSFSAKPLRLIGLSGLLTSGLGFALALVVICYRLIRPDSFPPEAVGWASLMVAVLVSSGIQMILFGALAEYTGRSFLMISKKPQTSIREVLNLEPVVTSEEFRERFRRPQL